MSGDAYLPTASAGALQPSFQRAAGHPDTARPIPDRPAPFSLRLSAKERALLQALAGSQPLGAYIRARLLGPEAQARATSRRPQPDHQKLALVLAELGRSRLASNMNQIAKAANIGALMVSSELNEELGQACQDIRFLRETLIAALGLKAEE